MNPNQLLLQFVGSIESNPSQAVESISLLVWSSINSMIFKYTFCVGVSTILSIKLLSIIAVESLFDFVSNLCGSSQLNPLACGVTFNP